MKLIDRYILRSFASTLAATFVVMIGLYLLLHIFSHVQDMKDAEAAFVKRGYSLAGGLLRYYLVHIPEMVVFFGPYAVLLAGMYTLYQLNQNNELVPLFAAGITRLRVAAPIFGAGAVVAIGLMGLKQEAVPALAREMVFFHGMLKGRSEVVTSSLPIFQDTRRNVFECDRWDTENRRIDGVWVDAADGRRAHFESLEWTGDGDEGRWTALGARSGDAFDPATETDLVPSDMELEAKTRNRMSFNELRRVTSRRPDRKDLAVIMHGHIAYAMSPLVLLLLGLPFVMAGRSKSVFSSLGLCLFLSLAYFTVSLALQRLGAQGEIVNPLLGAWLPIVVFGALGLVFFEAAGL